MTAITVINHYEFRTTRAAFIAATTPLCARVAAEGHQGVLSYHFYAGAASGHAQIQYRDAAAWFGHHDIAMPWPEMAALHQAARLARITFSGAVTPDIVDWLEKSGLNAEILQHLQPAGGFTR